jgi:hypothetical protein
LDNVHASHLTSMTTRLNIGRPELLEYRIWGDNMTWLRSGDHRYTRCSYVLWFGFRSCGRQDEFTLQSAIVCGNSLSWFGAVATHLDYVGFAMLDEVMLDPASSYQCRVSCLL